MPIIRVSSSSLRLLYTSSFTPRSFRGIRWGRSRETARVPCFLSSFRSYSDVPRSRDTQRITTDAAAVVEGIKPETLRDAIPPSIKTPTKQDGLLHEKIVSNAEQRKADWAIMKEMTRYLWPKVRLFTFICESHLTRLKGQYEYKTTSWTVCWVTCWCKGE